MDKELDKAAEEYASKYQGVGMNPTVFYAFKAGASYQSSRMNDGWIRVEERLPENNDNVLVYNAKYYNENCSVEVAFCDEYDKQWKGAPSYFIEGITHWQPLPEPPKHSKDINKIKEDEEGR